MSPEDRLAETVRDEGRRVLATLVRTLGDLQLAEDAVQEAAVAALRAWPETGVPDDPRAWLTVTARNKAYDMVRREAARPAKETAAGWSGPPVTARASGVTAVVDAASVPYLAGARDAVSAGYVSGGTHRNLAWVEPHTRFAAAVTESDRLLLADPQTSGGLLIAGEVPGAPVIGELVPRGEFVLQVR